MNDHDFENAYRLLEQAAEVGEDIWDISKNLGVEIVKVKDDKQFRLGDLACLVVKRYKEDAIGKWATEIGEKRSTVTGYRTVCSFWKKSAREDLLDRMPRVNYSLLRLTAHKFETPEAAEDFLIEVCDKDWSVEKASVALKKRRGQVVPPEKLIDGQHVEIVSLDYHTGLMTTRFIGGVFPTHLDVGTRGKMTMQAADITADLAVMP